MDKNRPKNTLWPGLVTSLQNSAHSQLDLQLVYAYSHLRPKSVITLLTRFSQSGRILLLNKKQHEKNK
jgi:hypothetical protein